MAMFTPANDGDAGVQESPDDILEEVRGTSCYRALRAVINVLFGAFLVASCLGIITGVQIAIHKSDFYGNGVGDNPFVGIAAICAGILIAFLGFAWRQASFLVIDIADLLIAQRTDARNRRR